MFAPPLGKISSAARLVKFFMLSRRPYRVLLLLAVYYCSSNSKWIFQQFNSQKNAKPYKFYLQASRWGCQHEAWGY
jgi:hypothetical protein